LIGSSPLRAVSHYNGTLIANWMPAGCTCDGRHFEGAVQAIADTRAPNLLRVCSTFSAEGGGKQTASRYD
jgi:hypothetical protein